MSWFLVSFCGSMYAHVPLKPWQDTMPPHVAMAPDGAPAARGVRVSVHHYGAVASTLETARRWQEALQLIGSCREPNQAPGGLGVAGGYPLVNIQKTMENHHF